MAKGLFAHLAAGVATNLGDAWIARGKQLMQERYAESEFGRKKELLGIEHGYRGEEAAQQHGFRMEEQAAAHDYGREIRDANSRDELERLQLRINADRERIQEQIGAADRRQDRDLKAALERQDRQLQANQDMLDQRLKFEGSEGEKNRKSQRGLLQERQGFEGEQNRLQREANAGNLETRLTFEGSEGEKNRENQRGLLQERQTFESEQNRLSREATAKKPSSVVQDTGGENVIITQGGETKRTGVVSAKTTKSGTRPDFVKEVKEIGTDGTMRLIFNDGSYKDIGPDATGPAGISMKQALDRAGKEASDRAGVMSTDATDFASYGGSRETFITQRALELYNGGGEANGSGVESPRSSGEAAADAGGNSGGVIDFATAKRLQEAGKLAVGSIVIGRDGQKYRKRPDGQFEEWPPKKALR